MRKTAYAVGLIDMKTRQLLGVGVYSEPEPQGQYFPVTLFKVDAPDFEQARALALKRLEVSSDYAWLRPYTEFKRGELGQPGETPAIMNRIEVLEDRMDRVLGHLAGGGLENG